MNILYLMRYCLHFPLVLRASTFKGVFLESLIPELPQGIVFVPNDFKSAPDM